VTRAWRKPRPFLLMCLLASELIANFRRGNPFTRPYGNPDVSNWLLASIQRRMIVDRSSLSNRHRRAHVGFCAVWGR